MSDQNTATHEPEQVDALDGARISGAEVWRTIYALFYNKKIGLLLILIVTILSLIGVVFPQANSYVVADEAAWEDFLTNLTPVYGGWTRILAAIGFFNMFSSWLFRIMMILLCLSIIGCTTHRIPLLYRTAYKPRKRASENFFNTARFRYSARLSADAETTTDALLATAKRRHMRVIADDAQREFFYLDRFHWAPFGTALSHLAFILIIIGFLVTQSMGFRNDFFLVTVGETQEVGYNTGLSAKVVSFQDAYNEDGRPLDYVSHVILYKDGQTVADQNVRVNSPLSYDGVMFHQASFGMSAVVSISGNAGELRSGGVPLRYTTSDGAYSYGVVELEDPALEVFVITSASGRTNPDLAPGQARIEVYESGSQETMDMKVVDQGQPATVAGLDITFEREAQYAGLIVRSDPGAWVVWLGSALLIIGSIMTMALRHQRMWAWVTATDDGSVLRLASHDKRDLGFSRYFHGFGTEITERITQGKEL
ncbi:hypothetical protein HMPREF3167_08880 [Trueperella sp. HMSC08B05]|uniref:Cytochrome c biogenesis protein CcsB n=1 Tax=Trueperella bernardiae TaxID=59561 RepID=A0A0W1KJM9_9ACTO|nr:MULTISPECIES: cytochrome c biogenesis protein ResB [Trueperella]KTF03847.1 Cytochrome c biogenesis protein CcsB [Trueperella bernardiae]MDK8602171.1 cytochrome c biogenesis protein ResB [Trueperella bernardiae]MDV6239812.1 cytochrome c biogenesis protein ResB [Trueperella bernardiae]OFS65621.1 hypothetical protein HMPREF3174_07690 [Trueperella sp. HMSC08H06]OFS72007.1 hypothetical protein HMPREF3167_08880 [Trueperella sp. HMSC08B05]